MKMNKKLKMIFVILGIGIFIVPYLDTIIFGGITSFGYQHYFIRTLVEFGCFLGGIFVGKKIFSKGEEK